MKACSRGFTLLEMLLVVVIMTLLIMMLANYMQQRTATLQIAKTSSQMQIILNAGLAYYRNNGAWPQDLQTLQREQYLPDPITNPWGQPYQINASANLGLFSVNTMIPEDRMGIAIAGRIPLGTFTANTVSGFVTIPAEELNSARAINFVSVYHSGACVPAPQCPLKMKPQIFILPASAYGINPEYAPLHASCTPSNPANCTFQVNALHKVSVWAIDDGSGNPVDLQASSGAMPACDPSFITDPDARKCFKDMTINSFGQAVYANQIVKGNYWRVCLNTITKFGSFTMNWAGGSGLNEGLYGPALGSVLVFTKCMPVDEKVGSTFSVWSY